MGLRQRDPLSPYLFIFCLEVLTRILNKIEQQVLLHGIKLARSPPSITHLMFLDNITIFFRSNQEEIENLESCIHKYQNWSRQQVNLNKSGIFFSPNTYRGYSIIIYT